MSSLGISLGVILFFLHFGSACAIANDHQHVLLHRNNVLACGGMFYYPKIWIKLLQELLSVTLIGQGLLGLLFESLDVIGQAHQLVDL